MKLRGLSRLRRIWWQLKRTFVPQWGAIILCYHRIADLPNSPRRLWVSPQRFAEQLEVLTQKFMPISLSELVNGLLEGQVPDRAVVVTFDDGYADNLWNARPILERFGVPATVFVTTGLVGTRREFYWDELERLLLCQETPPEISLTIDGNTRSWRLVTFGERRRAYDDLCDWLTPMAPEVRETILAQLQEQLGGESDGRPSHRLMTVNELQTISRDGLIDIGAHTVHHPDLKSLPPERQRLEIVTSKRQLEEWLGRSVRWFAYPYGGGDIVTRRLVQETGFEAACAMVWGLVSKSTDLFWLPRLFVANWDGDTFERRLREV